ncbi:MAG TPA: hypothetical protein PLH25_05930 [Flavobacterium sp.]|nr:hypothetical protein [Flavobacterium sp.]
MVLDKIFYFKNWRFQNRKSLELMIIEAGTPSKSLITHYNQVAT